MQTACAACSRQHARQQALRIFAYWLVSFGTIGLQYCYSVLYVEMLEALGGSREVTALVGSLCACVMDGCGLLSGT